MRSSRLPTRLKEDAGIIIFIVLLAALCRLAWVYPLYNWDILPTVALVNEPSSDPVRLHARAYATADAETPPEAARSFRVSEYDTKNRLDSAQNPWHFAEQLPLYSVKPLYILTLAAMHGAEIPTFAAARLLSVISFAVLGSIFFLWLRKFTGALAASLSTCFLLATPDFLSVGGETSPDAFFACLALAGIYLVFEKKQFLWGWCFLALVPLVRTDGLVLLVLIVALLAWKSPEFPWRYGVAILATEIIASQIMSWLGGGYSFRTLFYHSFVNRNPALAEVTVHLTAADYFRALYVFVLGSIASPRPLYFLLGLISLKTQGTPRLLRDLAWLAMAFAVIHVALFPLPDSRFLILPFALIVLWAAGSLASLSNGGPRAGAWGAWSLRGE